MHPELLGRSVSRLRDFGYRRELQLVKNNAPRIMSAMIVVSVGVIRIFANYCVPLLRHPPMAPSVFNDIPPAFVRQLGTAQAAHFTAETAAVALAIRAGGEWCRPFCDHESAVSTLIRGVIPCQGLCSARGAYTLLAPEPGLLAWGRLDWLRQQPR